VIVLATSTGSTIAIVILCVLLGIGALWRINHIRNK
jgi:hypothetical protein